MLKLINCAHSLMDRARRFGRRGWGFDSLWARTAKKIIMIEYENLREGVTSFFQRYKSLSPCTEGKARCCTADTPVIEGDQKMIKRAFLDGKLPDQIRLRALRNTSDADRRGCPFLSDYKECLIYEFRPVACIAFGLGGYPRSEQQYHRLFNKLQSGQNPEISVNDLESIFTCGKCATQLRSANARFPLKCIIGAVGAGDLINRTPRMSMRTFVSSQLNYRIGPLQSALTTIRSIFSE